MGEATDSRGQGDGRDGEGRMNTATEENESEIRLWLRFIKEGLIDHFSFSPRHV